MTSQYDYPAVQARLAKNGLLAHLQLACATILLPDDARVYVRAILGPDTTIRIKRVNRSWAYRHNGSITLAARGPDRRVKLSSVLHECAHQLDYRKGKLANGPHGESFCLTYARLLREVIS
jgi:hypothetical protein